MYYDILAMRALYGTADHNPGNTTYTYQSGADYWETIVDTGGEDTIAYDSTTGATIDLRDRHWSTLGNRIEFGNGRSEQQYRLHRTGHGDRERDRRIRRATASSATMPTTAWMAPAAATA